MAERILELYHDRARLKKMGENAREKVKENNEKSKSILDIIRYFSHNFIE